MHVRIGKCSTLLSKGRDLRREYKGTETIGTTWKLHNQSNTSEVRTLRAIDRANSCGRIEESSARRKLQNQSRHTYRTSYPLLIRCSRPSNGTFAPHCKAQSKSASLAVRLSIDTQGTRPPCVHSPRPSQER